MMNCAPVLSVAETRALERAAMSTFQLDELTLMQRAASALHRHIDKHFPEATTVGIAVGPGNNGGDGLWLASRLQAAGRAVKVIGVNGRVGQSAAAQAGLARCSALGIGVHGFSGVLPAVDLWVDALFGIGLARALSSDYAALVQALNGAGGPLLAVDVPSGINADTGSVDGTAVQALQTLTFFARKRGIVTGRGRGNAGRVFVGHLDLDAAWLDAQPASAAWLDGHRLQGVLVPRPHAAHKNLFGRVLVVGGDDGMAGAPRLSAEAALRCGAGLVTAFTRPANASGWLAALPEAMCLGSDNPMHLEPWLTNATVVVLGPGLGQSAWSRAVFDRVLSASVPLVIDADALNLLAQSSGLPGDAVLTPHAGEAARLLGTSSSAVVADPFAAAMAIASRYRAVTVLKGAGTVVADPAGRCCVIGGGNPGMAVPGMGDVLAGVIAALRAQGRDRWEAACLGVAVHAAAGDAAVSEGGEHGLMARDLMPYLRRGVNA